MYHGVYCSDKLAERGWALNPLQFPSAVHICLTLMHAQEGVAEQFVRDVREVVAECVATPGDKVEGAGVIYGMAQSLPDRSMVSDIASEYIDGLYRTDWSIVSNGK